MENLIQNMKVFHQRTMAIELFWKAIMTARKCKLVLTHFCVQESSQLLQVAFCSGGAGLHGKDAEHLVDPLQGQRLEVGEHAGDVGPEHAELLLPLICATSSHTVLLLSSSIMARREVCPALTSFGALFYQAPDVTLDLSEETLILPEPNLPPEGGEGKVQTSGQLSGCPSLLLLESVDDRRLDGGHRQVDLLVADFKVNVGKAQVRLPHKGAVAFECLKSFGVDIQGVGNLCRQLKVLCFELGPELGGEDQGVDGENLVVQLLALSFTRVEVRVYPLAVSDVLQHYLTLVERDIPKPVFYSLVARRRQREKDSMIYEDMST